VTLSVVMAAPSRPEPESVVANLRGPDGKVRQFPLEGGRDAIQAPPQVVLRPGESVTIRWTASK
jgi:hypothetical protein